MTIDDKVEAVEAFLDWRENTHPNEAPIHLVETWRAALEAAADARLLGDLRKEAEFALDDPAEARKLIERLIHG